MPPNFMKPHSLCKLVPTANGHQNNKPVTLLKMVSRQNTEMTGHFTLKKKYIYINITKIEYIKCNVQEEIHDIISKLKSNKMMEQRLSLWICGNTQMRIQSKVLMRSYPTSRYQKQKYCQMIAVCYHPHCIRRKTNLTQTITLLSGTYKMLSKALLMKVEAQINFWIGEYRTGIFVFCICWRWRDACLQCAPGHV